jgi:hypothetical protein
MTIVDANSGTNVHEIAAGIYRISTPVPGFMFNQYLIVDEITAKLLLQAGNVRVIRHRALHALRECLHERGVQP